MPSVASRKSIVNTKPHRNPQRLRLGLLSCLFLLATLPALPQSVGIHSIDSTES